VALALLPVIRFPQPTKLAAALGAAAAATVPLAATIPSAHPALQPRRPAAVSGPDVPLSMLVQRRHSVAVHRVVRRAPHVRHVPVRPTPPPVAASRPVVAARQVVAAPAPRTVQPAPRRHERRDVPDGGPAPALVDVTTTEVATTTTTSGEDGSGGGDVTTTIDTSSSDGGPGPN
jgi:hypothetical protein